MKRNLYTQSGQTLPSALIAALRSAVTLWCIAFTANVCLAQPIAETDFGTVNVVSLHDLQHRIPKPALKAFSLALKAMGKRDYESAVIQLEKSVTIDPEFYQAHNNLGVMYVYQNRSPLAIEHFEKAAVMNPRAPYIQRNLAVAYLVQGEFKASERTARRALDLDPSRPINSLVLGAALLMQNRLTSETERSLRKAAPTFPQADLWLAGAYFERGDESAAREFLSRYLDARDTDTSRVEIAKNLARRLGVSPQGQ
ncbi:MAG: tetratricopeptide repeat protein [Bryobacteraceae bacterium]|nr:tetratricopeptide repeat protein [Bryobacteraceae bacterium]